MDIRLKTAIVIGVTLAVLIGVLFTLSAVVILGGFDTLEKNAAEEDMNRVMTAMGNDLIQMDTIAEEWAGMEGVREIFLTNGTAGQASPVSERDFERLQYNLILFCDTSGTIVAGSMYDLNRHQPVLLPESLLANLAPENSLGKYSHELRLTGILRLSDGPMLIVMCPVYRNGSGDSPVLGTVIMGRYLDSLIIRHISAISKTSVEMFDYEDPHSPPEIITARSKFPAGQIPFMYRVNENYYIYNASILTGLVNETSMVTYARINDIFGRPAVIMRMVIPRSIYNQGRMTTDSFIVLVFGACLLFGLVILFLLETTVLSRISLLNNEVNSVKKTRDSAQKVTAGGSDEIGRLAGSVNGMLCELDAMHAQVRVQLVQSEERFSIFFNSSTDIVFVFSLSAEGTPESITGVNDAGCRRLGYSREEFPALPLESLFAENPEEGVRGLMKNYEQQGHTAFESAFLTKEKESFPVDVYAHRFTGAGAPAVLAICHDITERKAAEQQVLSSLQEKVILLREIHHRVRNTFQILISLMNLQIRDISDPGAQQAFRESQNRVRAMSYVYDKVIHSDDLATIDLAKYVRSLATHLASFYGTDSRTVTVGIDIRDVPVHIETAVTLGLVLNELISNSFRHAFPGGRKGRVTIAATQDAEHLTIIVKDDGIGLAAGTDWKSLGRLGFRLADIMVGQLQGTITLDQTEGVKFTIIIPATDRKKYTLENKFGRGDMGETRGS